MRSLGKEEGGGRESPTGGPRTCIIGERMKPKFLHFSDFGENQGKKIPELNHRRHVRVKGRSRTAGSKR